MQNCKDDYQATFIPHAMKEDVISRMLRDVARSAHAPASHSASHDHEKWRACLYEYGVSARWPYGQR